MPEPEQIDAPGTQPAEESPKRKLPVPQIVIGIIVLLGLGFWFKNWLWSRNHEATDNAQIAGDVVLVAPQVQGTVKEILVEDNAVVKQGQVLVTLQTDKLRAAVDQARANLTAAAAAASAAGVSVNYAQASSEAGIAASMGAAGEAGADIRSVALSAEAAEAAIRGAEASARSAQAGIESARLAAQTAREAAERAAAGIEGAKADLEQAETVLAQAVAVLNASSASHQLAINALERMKRLYQEGAESKARMEAAEGEEVRARQAEDVARTGVESAKAGIEQRRAALRSAEFQQRQAKAAAGEATSRIKSAQESAASASSNIDVARKTANAAKAKVGTASARQNTAQQQIQASRAQTINVEKLRADQKQAWAKVEQAKAALKTAEIDLEHAKIIAPVDGRIAKRSVEEGSLVQVGSALMYVVPSRSVYVMANFKETQVSRMKEGDEVEIDIDGLPGHKLHGKVASLAPATGSTFALIPPDNATGNFVKVVQRVPVKIQLDQSEIGDRLRIGLSVGVSVHVQ